MAKNKGPGRPKEYNTETLKRICNLIIDGHSLTETARKIGVTRQAIYKWRKEDDNFAEMYQEALEVRAEGLMDEILQISDDDSRDVIVDEETGRKTGNTTAVQRDKLRVTSRNRLMQWLNPKKFSERSNIDITSNGESVYGGLMITPPKEEEDVD